MNREIPAWLAYLTPIGWLIAYLQYSKSDKTSSLVVIHLRQMLGLCLMLIAVWMLQVIYIYSERINYITIPSYFLLFLFWSKGLFDALKKKEKPLPVIGKMLQQVCLFVR